MSNTNGEKRTEAVRRTLLQKISLTNWLLIIFILLMWWWHVETESRLDEIVRLLGT